MLRGIAALLVVIFHYTLRFDQVYGHDGGSFLPGQVARWGAYGVHVFFVISGFVILTTLQRSSRPADFVVSRFSRLFPAFWVAIAITMAVVHTAGLPGREVSVGDAAVNATMMPEFLGAAYVDGVYWTLSYELIFYVGMGLVAFLRAMPYIEWLGAGWLLLGMGQAAVDRAGQPVPEQLIRLLVLDLGYLFIAGIMIARIRGLGSSPFRVGILVGCVAVPAIAGSLDTFIVAIAAVGLVAFAARPRDLTRVGRLLVWVGGISYTLYLLHQNIGYVIIRASEDRGLPPIAAALVAFALVVALSAVVSASVERPAMRMIRTAYRRLTSARATS